MRLLRAVATLLAALLVTALLAAWLAPRFLDWDHYRDTIASVASAGLGRPVRIGGLVRLSLLPQPVLTAARVSIPDTGDGVSVTVQEMRLSVALGALLAGRVEVQELLLHDAQIRLPWPPGANALQHRPPAWLTRLHARVEASTLLVGGLAFTGIDGELAADPATGELSAAGLAQVLGRRWRVTARLGRAGRDGSATLAMSLDGQGEALNTGGAMSGQIAADGTLTGSVSGRGPDLSLLLAAPAMPWHAEGRLTAGGGLAVADNLDLDIGGNPARGAVALRLLPIARLDAALAASRLDLDAWLPQLLRGGGTALPTSLDLSAEAVAFAGGTVRRLRAGFEMAPDGVTIRDADAVLPGDAVLHLSGRVSRGHFQGEGRLDAPSLPDTLRWLQPLAPNLVPALSPLHTASLAANVTADPGQLALAGLHGQVDGAAVSGDVALHLGPRQAVAAALALTGPVLDPWLPDALPADLPGAAATLAALPHRLGGFDADLTLIATNPTWRGAKLGSLRLDALSQAGALTLRHLVVMGPHVQASVSGGVAAGGRLTDMHMDIGLADASELGDRLPPAWQSAQALFRGPANLHMTAAGELGALGLTAAADMADLRLEASGRADVPGRRWTGSVTLRHPGAPRLLEGLGLPDSAAWLGDGSLSLLAQVEASPGSLKLSGLDLSAGGLRATAALTLDATTATPSLTGQIQAETLPLPLPYARSPMPWPVASLLGWQAQVTVSAAHLLLGLSPVMEHASAKVGLAQGVLRIEALDGTVAGGHLGGQLTVDAAGTPHLSAQATLTGADIAGPLLDAPLDLTAGRLDAAVRLDASGYSPAALLATLSGTAQAAVQDGTLTGLDLAQVNAALAQPDAGAVQAGVSAGLAAGTTPFSRLDASATLSQGAVAFQQVQLAAAPGTITLTGTVDLPAAAMELRLATHPALTGAPTIPLRLIGPNAAPHRTPELADLARWLAQR
ncbi:MAG: AsmA family protein [Acetobacteraceae bacterium]